MTTVWTARDDQTDSESDTCCPSPARCCSAFNLKMSSKAVALEQAACDI